MKNAGDSLHAKVRAEAFGAYPESIINAAASAGMELWQVERIDANTLAFELYESSVYELEALADKLSMELKLTKNRDSGRRILKSRYVLLLFMACMGLMLLVSSLFIWQIEIHGNRRLSRGELLRALEDGGVAVGSFWPALRADDVRNHVMLELPELGWMTVNVSGSRAVVLVNEREAKPRIYDEDAPADLVAAKTGLVRRVSALSGKAAAEPGQAVTGGELLISGTLDSIMGTERKVCARGSVMADTWYEISAVCPEEEQLKSGSGLVRHRFALVFGKRRINFYINSGKAIDECDKIINEYSFGIDGHFALPVRLVHERIIPYDSNSGPGYDKEDMGLRLSSILEAGAEGQVLQSSFTESTANGLYVLTLRAHCVENIALSRDIGA